jgi:hypothetical protein
VKNFAAALLVLAWVFGSAAFGQMVDPVPQDAAASTWHVFSGGGANYIKPFGDHVGDLVNAPVHLDWQLRGWDISFGGRGKAPVRGPLYVGGGLKLSGGGATDHVNSEINFLDAHYLHLGADAYAELGLRFPIGQTHHIDLGGQIGGTGDLYNQADAKIHEEVLWVGPAVSLEPNAGTQGFLIGASLRIPVAGQMKLEDDFDFKWTESGGYMTRLEAGWVFQRGFTLVGYGEYGGYKFDNNDTGEFDQDHWTAGVEVRMTF